METNNVRDGSTGEDAVTKIPKPPIERDKGSRWKWTRVIGLAAFVALAIGRYVMVSAEGIEIRGAGCIGNCSDGDCCKGWIKLDPNGVGFARNFLCVDYMKTADEKGRGWVCRAASEEKRRLSGNGRILLSLLQTFKNCREAEEFIDRARADESLSVAKQMYTLRPLSGKIRCRSLPMGHFKAEVPVKWTLDKEENKLILPDWCWPRSLTRRRRK